MKDKVYRRKMKHINRSLNTKFPKELAKYLKIDIDSVEYIDFCINDRGEVVVRKVEEK